MKKIKQKREIVVAVTAFVILVVLSVAFRIMPSKDHIIIKDLPEEYFAINENNQVKFQSGKDCSGYAVAYVLRHLGADIQGPDLYERMHKIFGKVTLSGIQGVLKEYGYRSGSYYGTIDTLKMRLTKGVPVIVFITITLGSHKGLHYAVVVGYDKDYIYMADSTGAKTNISESRQYNRKVTYEEFEELWKTDIYPVNNLYTVIVR